MKKVGSINGIDFPSIKLERICTGISGLKGPPAARLFAVVDEVALGFDEVAGLEDHGLGLGEDVEVEKAGARRGLLLVVVKPGQLRLGHIHNQVEELVTHCHDIVYMGEVL